MFGIDCILVVCRSGAKAGQSEIKGEDVKAEAGQAEVGNSFMHCQDKTCM